MGEAINGAQATERASELRPDVVLMDLAMPRMDGTTATRQILADDETAKVLILTTSDTPATVLAAVRAGALGYVSKDASPETLHRAVLALHRGERFLRQRSPSSWPRLSRPAPCCCPS